MASWLEITRTTQTSIAVYVAGLATHATYLEIYVTIGGQRSVNLARGGSGYSTSLGFTANNLQAGTDYMCRWYLRSAGGNTFEDYIYIQTDTPPRPPTVGGVGYVSVSDYSMGAIRVDWSYANNAQTYRVEVFDYYSNRLLNYGSTSSNSIIISSLPHNTYVEVKVYGSRYDDGWGWNNGNSTSRYVYTKDYSVGNVGYVYVDTVASSGVLDVRWSYATNANSYSVEVWTPNDVWLGYRYSTTSNSYRITGLNENTNYKIKVYGTGAVGNGNPSYGYGKTYSFAPAPITQLGASAGDASGGIHVWWASSANVTKYRWEIYLGRVISSAYYVTGGYVESPNLAYSGLSQYTEYTIKIYGTRPNYDNGDWASVTVRTKDLTKPSVSITSSDGKGRMNIFFNASDAHSGLRSINTYYTEISNANGSSYSRGAYTTNNYKTFTEDAYGNEFVHDAWYYMKVTAYDAEGNNDSTNVRVQFKLAKPSEWGWHKTKTAGQPLSLTAQEWNSFCIKINQFRQYKSLSNYSFTTVSSGGLITASIVNQAITAISAMSPSTSPPAKAVANSTVITASFFNTLSGSLNSVK